MSENNTDEDNEINMRIGDEIIQNFVDNILNNLINPDLFFRNDEMFSLFYDPIDDVLRESLENQPDPYVKTTRELLINSKIYKEITDIEKDKSCSICLNDFVDTDIVSRLDVCSHIFHNDCLKEWGYYVPTCPICRKEIEYK